jgi:hypothetical protein
MIDGGSMHDSVMIDGGSMRDFESELCPSVAHLGPRPRETPSPSGTPPPPRTCRSNS